MSDMVGRTQMPVLSLSKCTQIDTDKKRKKEKNLCFSV